MADLADFLHWFKSGNSVVDGQHRRIFAICNEAVSALDAYTTDREVFYRVLNDVADLMRLHFRTEEAILRDSGDPKLNDHVEAHHALELELVDLLLTACVRVDCGYRKRFEKFLASWLKHHLSEVDAQASVGFNPSR